MANIEVIMPVHGEALYFEEALESCLFQMPDNYLITIVFDRPSSLVVEIAERYAKQFENLRLKYSPAKGIVAALNHGLLTSTATFIARMDCDDLMNPERIKKQFNYLQENVRVVCLGTQIEMIDASNQTISFSTYPLDHDSLVREFSNQNPMAHPTVMYRRESVISVGMYREAFSGSEDFDLWTRLAKIGELFNLRDALVKYRIHSSQVTQQNKIKLMVLTSSVRINFLMDQTSAKETFLATEKVGSLYEKHKKQLGALKEFNARSYSIERHKICLQLNQIPESGQLIWQYYPEFIPELLRLRVLAMYSKFLFWIARKIDVIFYKFKKIVNYFLRNESYPYIAKKVKSLSRIRRFFKNTN